MIMRCEAFLEGLDATADPNLPPHSPLMQHAAQCRSCRDALAALRLLAAERRQPVPQPTDGAFERAVRAAVRAAATAAAGHAGAGQGDASHDASHAVPQDAASASVPGSVSRYRHGFWTGLAAGMALAASVVVAVLWLRSDVPQPPLSTVVPQLTMVLHETRDVSIAMESAEALTNVEIRVLLSGSVVLAGFEGQRELSWRTDLDRGMNRLTLPVVAQRAGAGQVLVEVVHQDRRRTFVVDVRTRV